MIGLDDRGRTGTTRLAGAVAAPHEDVHLVFREDGEVDIAPEGNPGTALLPGIYPERLGDRHFCSVHGLRFAYVVGAMARGITSARMVIAAREAGFGAFFGAAGLDLGTIGAAIDEIQAALGPNGGVIVEVIPDVELIVGPQPPPQSPKKKKKNGTSTQYRVKPGRYRSTRPRARG